MYSRKLFSILPVVLFLLAQMLSITAALQTISNMDTIAIEGDWNVEHIVTVDPFLAVRKEGRTDPKYPAVVQNFLRAIVVSYFPQPPPVKPAQNVATHEQNIWLTNRVLLI